MKLKLILFFILINCSVGFTQDIPIYSFKEFEPVLHKNNDSIYVINFWATWCKPCVKEIPIFNQLNRKYKNSKVEIILVSLDFGKDVQSRIKQFKETHKIESKVLILDDPDANSWINKVSKEWSGAIPATLIYNQTERMFYEQSFELSELEAIIEKFIEK